MARNALTTTAPGHLSAEMVAWWRSLCRRYKFAPQHLRVLEVAADAWDRKIEARTEVKRDGLTVRDRFGQARPHPAVAIERDASVIFLRAVRELALADDDLPDESRPPRIAGRYQGETDMPLRPRLAAQKTPEYSPAIRRYVQTGEYPEHGDFWEVLDVSGNAGRLRDAWLALRGGLLRAWATKHPGTRPWAWWCFDAPRWRREGWPARQRDLGPWAENVFPEPRKRLGGRGTPAYEVLNYLPAFVRGIPTSWVSRFDEAYYNGRARDVHGDPIGIEYHAGQFAGVAPDPKDPPIFESEAAYLERHKLLSAAERRRLTPADFEPEALDVSAADDEGPA